MKLGTKIIVSFVCISILIATIGIVSQWYSNSVQNQLLTSNIETTKLVETTATIERGLYQSLVLLTAIKEAETTFDNETTIDEPTRGMLSQNFDKQIDDLVNSINAVKQQTIKLSLVESPEAFQNIQNLERSMSLYISLSSDWLMLVDENSEQVDAFFNTSISPFFRNRVIPDITKFRNNAIERQNIENDVLTSQLDQANYAIFVVSLICIVLAIIIALYVYRSIANPLAKLNISAQKFGKGDLDEEIEILSNDEIGELAESFNTMASNLKKRTLARDYLDNIIETIREALIVTDTDGLIVGINKAGLDMLHYHKDEIIGLPIKMFYDLENMGSEYVEQNKNGRVFEFSLLTKRKKRIPVLFSEADLVNGNGLVVGKVSVATDITERKKTDQQIKNSLKEKEILLAEIHHRVKNNLSVISGLLQLQIYKTKNDVVLDALSESQSRIQSISLVHEMLYQSDSLSLIDYRTYVNDLIQAIISIHMNESIKITVNSNIENISLDVSKAISCSLLLNEILVNSFKHAFIGMDKGTISISMKEREEEYELIVIDDGVGLKLEDYTESKSLGTTLINTLATQLRGELFFMSKEADNGTRIQFTFPK